jgi:UDP-N-acetylglucosamine 3-dehydrogenase
MINVAILGAGFMGLTHALAYQKLPGVQVALVADIDPAKGQKLAEAVGARAVADADEVFADPVIHLVDVTLPTPFHPAYAIRAMEAGKHVVVEKPLALTMEEVEAILEAQLRTGQMLFVAQVLRFWPEYVLIHEIVRSGRLGRPLSAAAFRLSNPPQWATWFLDPGLSGGTVLDLGIHDLDMMNWLFGKPRSVFAGGVKGAGSEDWSHVQVLLDYGAAQSTVEASFMMPKDFLFTAGLRVLCEKGMLEYVFRAGGASIEEGQPVNSLVLHEPGKPNQVLTAEPGEAFEREIAYFIRCIQSDTPPQVVTGEDARLAVHTALLARNSIETGQPQPIPD